MIKLTDEMRSLIDSALANRTPCILATASPSGVPNMGFKGSVMVFDDGHLAYWERTRRAHLANLERNPHLVVLFADLSKRTAWRFHGVATLHPSGPVRDQVMARTVKMELDRDPERKGVAVVMRVDKVYDLATQLIQQRE
jgi:hypothetical protein